MFITKCYNKRVYMCSSRAYTAAAGALPQGNEGHRKEGHTPWFQQH
jgi:hypothetical protein